MKRERIFRISCFAPGAELHHQCLRHFAPKTRDRAELVFARERAKIRCGAVGFVVMHQGNLKRHSFKIIRRCDVWSRSDELAAKHTAFQDFADLLHAAGQFYPSLNVGDPERLELANLYDAAQSARSDSRRAHRWQS